MIFTLFLFLLFVFIYPKDTLANEISQFVTVVNPVRISLYTKDIQKNLELQYGVIRSNELLATWLLTFDAITDSGVLSVVDDFDEDQELGIFLEITPNFAKEAGVEYNDTGFWHHATSVFLSGYTQEERIKLIDSVFDKFRERFGFYPRSVGAWWIDSFSLDYMQSKYEIVANLGVADQFSTDGYQVWGQYWSTPYYPSKFHAGIPASNEEVKLDVVTLQWAPRDPFNGYFNSYYSTQDYLQKPVNQNIGYFEELINLYARKNRNKFGHVTVGLEADLSLDVYSGEFKRQIEAVKRLSETGEFKVISMGEFGNWYRQSFPNLSPPQVIETDDFLGKTIKVIWYQSPKYRIGISYNYETKATKIFDFRTYNKDFQEPYFISPNREFTLSIYILSYFDEVNNTHDVWLVDFGEFKSTNAKDKDLVLDFEKGNIELKTGALKLQGKNLLIPDVLQKSPTIKVLEEGSQFIIELKDEWIVTREGYIFRDLTEGATHSILRKRTWIILFLGSLIFLSLSFLTIRSNLSERTKLLLLTVLIVIPLTFFHFWYKRNSSQYYVSQAEIDALYGLSVKPPGKILVYDKECLGCEWHTKYKPAVFANKRGYVRKWGKHPVVYNSSVFEAKNQKEAKEEFDKLGVKYIYVVKYEDYIEKTPFSPGDLGIEKVYSNANAEVWRVKEDKN